MTNINLKNAATVQNLLLSLHIFNGCDPKIIEREIDRGSFICREYAAGETVYSPDDGEKRIIIFRTGKAHIYSTDQARSVLLRTVGAGKVIGVANLFSAEGFVSRVIADKKCETVEISDSDFARILESDVCVLRNYVSFLSDKICYLNRKIVYLTAGSAERSLATFLDSLATENGSDSFDLSMPMNSLAEMLNIGRASLYRAVEKLESDGFLIREGKKITLINRERMLESYSSSALC